MSTRYEYTVHGLSSLVLSPLFATLLFFRILQGCAKALLFRPLVVSQKAWKNALVPISDSYCWIFGCTVNKAWLLLDIYIVGLLSEPGCYCIFGWIAIRAWLLLDIWLDCYQSLVAIVYIFGCIAVRAWLVLNSCGEKGMVATRYLVALLSEPGCRYVQ